MVIRQNQTKGSFFFETRASSILHKFFICHREKIKKPFVLPVNICPVVKDVLDLNQIEIRYIDIEKEDLCVNRTQLLQWVRNKEIDGFLFNHAFGANLQTHSFFEEIKKADPSIIIIEDCCLCPPVFDYTPDIPDLVLFSTGYAKYVELNNYGYGYSRDIGKETLSRYDEIRGNLLLPTENSMLVLDDPDTDFYSYEKIVLQKRLEVESHKNALNKIYKSHIPQSKQLSMGFNNWRFNIRAHSPHAVLKRIFAAGLFASTHYQPLSNEPGKFPVATEHARSIVNLFNDFHFTPGQAEAVSKIIKEEDNDFL